jgi:phage FluMu protein Com
MSAIRTRTPAGPAATPCETHEVRCICRNLIARRSGEVLEFKCRRCKRVLRVRIAGDWEVTADD